MPLRRFSGWTRCALHAGLAVLILASAGAADAADPPTPEAALAFRPSRPNVDFDAPAKEEISKCKVQVERQGEVSGWMVLGPEGQILRRYLDTDGDNVVDQWRYFRNGMEIYRDMDTDANRKMDQFRFVNEGGSRWGIDENEDGKIDSWKVLSAEEASQIAVEAMLARDAGLLSTVLISEQDTKEMGLAKEIAEELLESVADPAAQLKTITEGSKVFASGSKWIKLDSSMPGLVPADAGKAEQDLFVRENAVAILDLQGETGLAQVGEIVRNGEVWKLTQIPQPIEGDMRITSGGILMQPATMTTAGVPGGISDEMKEQLEQLQALDAKAPAPQDGVDAFSEYNGRRAEILAGLIEASETDEDKEMWTRQFADSVSAAVTTGVYPEGLQKLAEVEKRLADTKADPALQSYVQYRRMFAEYYKRLRESEGDSAGRIEVQQWWHDQLESFVKGFPKSPDAAEALLQLALSEEFSGNLDEAAKWYEKLAAEHAESGPGMQAKGALYRLGLKGKPFEFTASSLKGGEEISGTDFQGKVLLVLFWSTTCQPCEEDLPALLSLYQQYHGQGFEVLGVNLDPTAENVAAYLQEKQVPWPQVHEPGGMESEPARQFGIITLPTMLLVGRDGKVISRGTSVEDLEATLPELLKGQ